MTTQEKPILLFNTLYLTSFALYAVLQKNYEFIFYVSIVLFFIILIVVKNKKIGLSPRVLWGLSAWGLLHMMGGTIPVHDSVLYNLQLIPVLLKYDQFVHAFGFGTTTIVGYQLLRPYLKTDLNWTTLSLLLILIGLGAGAMNEILEFIATVIIPETNVGGYVNTSLDLVFNLIGATIAGLWLKKTHAR
ncbi:MAG: hypothetical protein COU33_01285 [Candidatus Magasanikbacteria bacterium CG10_big_fil_rev_8_21_14_0_10_43_6]|uniref:DUF2238 domain-containing protein n=1 Tax=Candidatus Magasanikbacteria bacterium CG10_big_fil_rev_8_21_14_0_10_43_6 TaxID=1974650 RepID=A0A2M6W1W5_9BACT|nr:MAG: hypothetical protein COU33_01285 [Candidatus Magasanikbacteria bacterium CG10_big_fil_rev_8_21_14_0_10_43_6]